MPPPYVAVANRKPAQRGPILAPSQLNARLHELIIPQEAPEKPRQGDVPSRPARMPMYAVLAKREKRAIMYDAQSGVIGKTEFDQFVSSPRGKSLTWDERANIERQPSETFGSRYNVTPQTQPTDESRLRLLMGV